MNKKIARSLFLGMALLTFRHAHAQDTVSKVVTMKDLKAEAEAAKLISPFLPDKPTYSQGDTINVLYRPQFAHHNDSAGVKASVYLYRNFVWEGQDLPIRKTDKGWAAAFVIPAGTAMIDFHFLIDDSVDKGGRVPYGALVHRKPEVMARGAYTEWGLMRSKDKNGMPLNVVNAKMLIAPEVNMIWVPMEWHDSLVLKNMLPGIARAVKAAEGDSADSLLRTMAVTLLRKTTLTERQYLYVQKMYSDVLLDKKTADSLQQIIVARFPGGLADRLANIRAFQRMHDSSQKANTRAQFLLQYPLEKYPLEDYIDPEVGEPTSGSHMFMEMSFQAFNHKDWTRLKELMKVSPFQYLDYFYEHFCMFPFRTDNPSISPKDAAALSDFLVDEILQRMKDPDPIVSGRKDIAPAEWMHLSMQGFAEDFGYHLGFLLDNHHEKAAYELGQSLLPYLGVKNITFNANYTRAMHLLKHDEEAIAFIKAAVFANKVTPAMLTVLEEEYHKTNGAGGDFLGYYQSLKNLQTVKKEHAELESSLFHTPAPALSLPDMKGRTVSLASLKGKIVVLDFWATWCYPCKAAMPGMQMAINKFKGDTNVVFLFVSTMEEKPDYKASISRFLKEKKYDFTVICDQPDPDSHKDDLVFSRYASLFNMQGIPQKLIINQDGNVCWKAGGFYGNVIQVADEVSYVVEYLKSHHS